MNRRLHTIGVHGLNIAIVITLFMFHLISNKAQIVPSIYALSDGVVKSNNDEKVIALNQKIKNDIQDNNVNIKVDDEKIYKRLIGMSAIIYDNTNDKVIWSYNSSKPSSLASITKVMTALVYKTSCDKDIYYSGLNWKSDDAVRFMLIQSSNDMAEALAKNCMSRDLFIKNMNQKAEELKLNLHYTNPSGMDYPGVIGGRGDAFSVARLLYIASSKYPNIFDYTTTNASTLRVERGKQTQYIEAINTNQDVSYLVGARASKTGLTDYAGGNLGIVYDPYVGETLSLVVLGSTKEGRFMDIELMLDNIKIEGDN